MISRFPKFSLLYPAYRTRPVPGLSVHGIDIAAIIAAAVHYEVMRVFITGPARPGKRCARCYVSFSGNAFTRIRVAADPSTT